MADGVLATRDIHLVTRPLLDTSRAWGDPGAWLSRGYYTGISELRAEIARMDFGWHQIPNSAYRLMRMRQTVDLRRRQRWNKKRRKNGRH